jgi:hypothetical protein
MGVWECESRSLRVKDCYHSPESGGRIRVFRNSKYFGESGFTAADPLRLKEVSALNSAF